MVNLKDASNWNKHAIDYFVSLQWPSFMASLRNAFFGHREYEILPSKRKSHKILQYSADSQWHDQFKFVTYTVWIQVLKSNTNNGTTKASFDLYPLFVVCFNMVAEYGEPYLASNSEVSDYSYSQSNKVHTEGQDKQRIRRPVDFTRSRPLLRSESGKKQ